jgi:hypothetical protein
VIISASYKTDIPTFYGEWFANRLRAGYCKVVNPYNKVISRVSLRPEDVHGFVFWTKNVGPFIKHLAEVRDSRVTRRRPSATSARSRSGTAPASACGGTTRSCSRP